ncbi:MAG: hypothetical protein JXB49_32655 [Bacteroidales bacterium]|nr:hypothetical protein [Bacteroidales bacterium]
MKSFHFDILKLGYTKGTRGIVFNEVKKELNIKFPSKDSELNFLIWFYSNFYNKYAEKIIVNHTQSGNPVLQTKPDYLDKFDSANSSESYLRGESLAKYVDYLELVDTRKSSNQARVFSVISIGLATLAIVVPLIVNNIPQPPFEVVINNPKEDSIKVENKIILQQLDSIEVNRSKTGTELDIAN